MEPDPSALLTVTRVFDLSAAGRLDREVAAEVGLPLFTVRGMLTSRSTWDGCVTAGLPTGRRSSTRA